MITPRIVENQKRLEPDLHSIGDEWQNLIDVLEWITQTKQLPPQKDRQWSQAIIWGETDGLLGLENVKALLSKYPQAAVLFSGGVYGREGIIHDIGAIDLYKSLESELLSLGWNKDEIKRRTLIESLSLHTGHQSLILSHILKALGCVDVFLVEPLYHMPRFILMFGYQLKKLGLKPNLIPTPYGAWDSVHPAKAPASNPSQKFKYEELFASPPTESLFEGKFDCGEADKIIQQVRNENCMTCREFMDWFAVGPV